MDGRAAPRLLFAQAVPFVWHMLLFLIQERPLSPPPSSSTTLGSLSAKEVFSSVWPWACGLFKGRAPVPSTRGEKEGACQRSEWL